MHACMALKSFFSWTIERGTYVHGMGICKLQRDAWGGVTLYGREFWKRRHMLLLLLVVAGKREGGNFGDAHPIYYMSADHMDCHCIHRYLTWRQAKFMGTKLDFILMDWLIFLWIWLGLMQSFRIHALDFNSRWTRSLNMARWKNFRRLDFIYFT